MIPEIGGWFGQRLVMLPRHAVGAAPLPQASAARSTQGAITDETLHHSSCGLARGQTRLSWGHYAAEHGRGNA